MKQLVKLCGLITLFACDDPAPNGKFRQDQGIDSSIDRDWAPPLPIVTDARPIIGDSTLQDAHLIKPDSQLPDAALNPVDAQSPDATVQACAAVDCSHLDDFCVIGTCDPASGDCYPRRKSDNEPCDDGRACTTNSHTGAHSFGSGDIDDDEISRLTRVLDYDQRVDVVFWYRVSSEDNYDFFDSPSMKI